LLKITIPKFIYNTSLIGIVIVWIFAIVTTAAHLFETSPKEVILIVSPLLVIMGIGFAIYEHLSNLKWRKDSFYLAEIEKMLNESKNFVCEIKNGEKSQLLNLSRNMVGIANYSVRIKDILNQMSNDEIKSIAISKVIFFNVHDFMGKIMQLNIDAMCKKEFINEVIETCNKNKMDRYEEYLNLLNKNAFNTEPLHENISKIIDCILFIDYPYNGYPNPNPFSKDFIRIHVPFLFAIRNYCKNNNSNTKGF